MLCSRFRRELLEKQAPGLRGTDEELTINLCRDYNLTPDEAEKLYEYELIIYTMLKEKEAFENWYALKDESRN